jgi:hypothetical protein
LCRFWGKGDVMLTQDHLVAALGTVLTIFVLYLLCLLLVSRVSLKRIRLALRCELRALRDQDFAAKIEPLLNQAAPEPAKSARPSGAPLRVLALLQREGRLLDFLLEDIQAYPDAQVGAAVRDIHRQCQAVLKEHLDLQPVLQKDEGSAVEISAGFDPSAIRLTGNVTGQPPFRGTLQHHGWRVKELKLTPPPEGQDEFVLMPAEVELP